MKARWSEPGTKLSLQVVFRRKHGVAYGHPSIRFRPLPRTYSLAVSATPKLSAVWQVSVGARKLPEVLPRAPGDPCDGWCAVPAVTSQKSQSERLRGTLGTFNQRGGPVAADPARGEVVAAGRLELFGTLSPGTRPPRQGQSVAVYGRREGGKFARRDPLSRAARRPTKILQPCV